LKIFAKFNPKKDKLVKFTPNTYIFPEFSHIHCQKIAIFLPGKIINDVDQGFFLTSVFYLAIDQRGRFFFFKESCCILANQCLNMAIPEFHIPSKFSNFWHILFIKKSPLYESHWICFGHQVTKIHPKKHTNAQQAIKPANWKCICGQRERIWLDCLEP
jgi:hypothetical protein